MEEYSTRQVLISDSLWTARLEVNSSRAIFHQWEQLEDSGCIDNFRIVAGDLDGFREGWFFADSDAYKWLDAAARIHGSWPDSELDSLVENLIALIARAQAPDGYLFTYNQFHFPGKRWVNLMIEHELYCHGHLIEAGVSHFEATEKTSLLDIACKAADRVTADFLGKGPAFTPGHEEIEIALLRLYQATGHDPYLKIARQFLEQRGRSPRVSYAVSQIQQLRQVAARITAIRKQRKEYIRLHPGFVPKVLPPNNYSKSSPNSYLRWLSGDLNGKYLQQHLPVREQTVPVGHSVRFGYLETAIAMLQRIDADPSLRPPMEKAWERMVTRRMFVTGGIGSVPGLEGFGRDYELDPEYAYAETCAALASMFWSWELALITREAKYSDLFEWQLYNASGVGMGLTGTNYLYNNPLACKGGITRRPWYSVPCCPSNLSRTWANLGKYIYSVSKDTVWIHQYIGSTAHLEPGVSIKLVTESGLPWDGKVKIVLTPATPARFTINFRIPSWVPDAQDFSAIQLNAGRDTIEILPLEKSPSHSELTAQGYDPRLSRFLSITRIWSPGDQLEMDFSLPVTLRHAHPKVKGHDTKVAATRGPLVYCLESLDNPGVDIFTIRLDPYSLTPELRADLLDGVTVLHGRSIDGQPLTFIPYYLWANRGESQMTVWVCT